MQGKKGCIFRILNITAVLIKITPVSIVNICEHFLVEINMYKIY